MRMRMNTSYWIVIWSHLQLCYELHFNEYKEKTVLLGSVYTKSYGVTGRKYYDVTVYYWLCLLLRYCPCCMGDIMHVTHPYTVTGLKSLVHTVQQPHVIRMNMFWTRKITEQLNQVDLSGHSNKPRVHHKPPLLTCHRWWMRQNQPGTGLRCRSEEGWRCCTPPLSSHVSFFWDLHNQAGVQHAAMLPFIIHPSRVTAVCPFKVILWYENW